MNAVYSNSTCMPMPPPVGVAYTGKLYSTGEKVKALIGPFLKLIKESPEFAPFCDSKELIQVKVEFDAPSTGAIKESLCFIKGIPVSYLADKKMGDILSFTARFCIPVKLEYMGEI